MNSAAQVIIHEGMHLNYGIEGVEGWFGFGMSDTQIADALGIEYEGTTDVEQAQDASEKWQNQLKQHCH